MNLAKDYRVNGMCVFQALFRKHESYQKLFAAHGATEWDALAGSVRLMCHAAAVLKAVGTAVNVSHDETASANLLLRLGGEHVSRKVGNEHFKSIFPIIIDQLVVCNGGKLSRPIWVKYFDYMTAKLTEGLAKPVDGGKIPSEAAVRDIFNDWDTDKDGSLSAAELEQVMCNLSVGADPEKIKAMVAEADVNKDQLIQFEEFINVFNKHR